MPSLNPGPRSGRPGPRRDRTNRDAHQVQLEIRRDELRPLIEEVVAETIAKLEAQRDVANGKLAYSEYEAAQLISLTERQLADERRRGRIKASSIVGRRIRYLRSDLITYLLSRRSADGSLKKLDEDQASG